MISLPISRKVVSHERSQRSARGNDRSYSDRLRVRQPAEVRFRATRGNRSERTRDHAYPRGGTESVTGLGVIIADLVPLGPAAAVGLRLQDIIESVDDRQVVGLPGLAAALYLHPADEDLKLEVLRGRRRISVVVRSG
jgi:S1-C subfamily serine protease